MVEFVDALGIAGDSSGVEISAHFEAEIRGASNAIRDQYRSDFTVVAPAKLVLPQLLDGQGGRAECSRPYRGTR